MKMARFTVSLGIMGLFLGLGGLGGSTGLAQTDTYVFTATAGQNEDFNGSTITVDGTGANGVSAFSFYDTALSSTPFTSGTVESDAVHSYSTSGWDGTFAVSVAGNLLFATTTNFNLGLPPVVTSSGTWAYEPAGGSVPDESNTFSLLAAGVGAMVVWLNHIRSKSPAV